MQPCIIKTGGNERAALRRCCTWLPLRGGLSRALAASESLQSLGGVTFSELLMLNTQIVRFCGIAAACQKG